MDAAKAEQFKLPLVWIDRIFARLTDIYGTQFTSSFSKPEYMEMEKQRWRGGLYGLNTDQIKKVLNMCLNNEINTVPNVIEFYHYGIGWKAPIPKPEPKTERNKEVASEYMTKIRTMLNGKIPSNSNTPVPYQRK